MRVPRTLIGGPGRIAATFVWVYFPFACLFAAGAMTTTGYTPWRALPEALLIYVLSAIVLWGQNLALRGREKEEPVSRYLCFIAAGLVVLPVYGMLFGPVSYAVAIVAFMIESPKVDSMSDKSVSGEMPAEPGATDNPGNAQ